MKLRVLFLFLTLLVGCTTEKNSSQPLLEYIPQNASVLIKINDLSAFKSELKNNDFLSKSQTSSVYSDVLDKIKILDILRPTSESLLAFSELGKENFEFTYITLDAPGFIDLQNPLEKPVETINYQNKSIYKYVVDGATLYSIKLDNKIIVS